MATKRYKRTPSKKQKLHVKTGDLVQVISGKSKGKIGKIINISPSSGSVVVEGVNYKTKHIRPKMDGESGRIETREFPIHSSNVMLYSEKEKCASRVCYTFNDQGKKLRMLKKTGEIID